jgi:hypothetical protein
LVTQECKSLPGELPTQIANWLVIAKYSEKIKRRNKLQQLLDDARKELAIKHLKQPYSSTTDIAAWLFRTQCFLSFLQKRVGKPSAFRA